MNIVLEGDPIVTKKIGNKFLKMRKSHKLPLYYDNFPFYDRALPRVCKKLFEIDGYLTVIDVGANIGDTVSLITDEVCGSFLCVEGDKDYVPLLEMNMDNIKNSQICIVKDYCSNENEYDSRFAIERLDGTAKLVINGDNRNSIHFKRLDDIIKQYSIFKSANMLKIDTDGFEISVLKSGENFISESKPMIYFEFVPELYIDNNHDPMFVFEFLSKKGYEEVLFYDNFGISIGIVNVSDRQSIEELISRIDNTTVYYYDILAWHNSKYKKYESIFRNELEIAKLK